MILHRRGFLSAILLAGTAPAIVRASSLMKIIVPEQAIILPSKLSSLSADFDGDSYALAGSDWIEREYVNTWNKVEWLDAIKTDR
jgi:hypothetical protein